MTAKGNKLNCALCGKEATANANGQQYCTIQCRTDAWNKRMRTLTKRKCTECGEYYMGAKGRKFCSDSCANTAKFAKWTNLEIIYLASLNPGYGFRKFIRTLYTSQTGSERTQMRVLDILQKMKEDTGNDYYEWLQNPDYMQRLSLSDYVAKYGITHVPKYQGRVGGRGVPRENSKVTIKTDKSIEFQWGRFAEDPRVKGE